MDLGGDAERGTHGIEIVDHAAGEQEKGPFHRGWHITNGLAAGGGARIARRFHHPGRNIIKAADVELAHVQVVVRVQMVDLDKANVLHRRNLGARIFIGRVVDLHIAGLGNHTSTLGRGRDRIDLFQRKAERLFDKEVFACFQHGERRFGLRVGLTEQHCLDIAGNQFTVVGEMVRNIKLLGHIGRGPSRDITDRGDGKVFR